MNSQKKSAKAGNRQDRRTRKQVFSIKEGGAQKRSAFFGFRGYARPYPEKTGFRAPENICRPSPATGKSEYLYSWRYSIFQPLPKGALFQNTFQPVYLRQKRAHIPGRPQFSQPVAGLKFCAKSHAKRLAAKRSTGQNRWRLPTEKIPRDISAIPLARGKPKTAHLPRASKIRADQLQIDYIIWDFLFTITIIIIIIKKKWQKFLNFPPRKKVSFGAHKFPANPQRAKAFRPPQTKAKPSAKKKTPNGSERTFEPYKRAFCRDAARPSGLPATFAI